LKTTSKIRCLIKQYCKSNKIKQKKMSELVGVPYHHISWSCRGLKVPILSAEKISDFLKVRMSDFFELSGFPMVEMEVGNVPTSDRANGENEYNSTAKNLAVHPQGWANGTDAHRDSFKERRRQNKAYQSVFSSAARSSCVCDKERTC
jgi:predicted XRE-type DNA-binding protein